VDPHRTRTENRSSRRSTRQHEVAVNADAACASPVRRLKQAWCHGQRTVSSAIRPSPGGPADWVQVAPIANTPYSAGEELTSSNLSDQHRAVGKIAFGE
jgi:hypothetical protein